MMSSQLKLKTQEIPYDDSESSNMFRLGPNKPLVATPATIEAYTHETIIKCFAVLRSLADEKDEHR